MIRLLTDSGGSRGRDMEKASPERGFFFFHLSSVYQVQGVNHANFVGGFGTVSGLESGVVTGINILDSPTPGRYTIEAVCLSIKRCFCLGLSSHPRSARGMM